MRKKIDISNTPHYRCLSCKYLRNACGGLPTRDLPLEEWCALLRAVKDKFNLVNAEIAKASEVSLTTTERAMAGTLEPDIMRGTQRRLELVVLGPVSYAGCLLEREVLEEQLQTVTNKYNDAQKKIDFLADENARKAKMIDKLLEK